MCHPSCGSGINRVHSAESTTCDDLFHFPVMLTVTVLMADDRLDAAFSNEIANSEEFTAGESDGFFERDEFGATVDAGLDEARAQMWHCAKAENVWLDVLCEGSGVGTSFWVAEPGGSCVEARSVDVTDTGHFETRVRVEREGVMHTAFSHSYNNDRIRFHVF